MKISLIKVLNALILATSAMSLFWIDFLEVLCCRPEGKIFLCRSSWILRVFLIRVARQQHDDPKAVTTATATSGGGCRSRGPLLFGQSSRDLSVGRSCILRSRVRIPFEPLRTGCHRSTATHPYVGISWKSPPIKRHRHENSRPHNPMLLEVAYAPARRHF